MADASRSLTSSSLASDMPLDEKEEFYKQIDELDTISDDNEDGIDDARQQSRDFIVRAKEGNRKRPSHPKNTSNSTTLHSKRLRIGSASTTPAPTAPNIRTAPESITPTVVEATPSLREQSEGPNPRRLQISKSFVQDTPQDLRSAPLASLRRTQTTPGTTAISTSLAASVRQLPQSSMAGANRGRKSEKSRKKEKEVVPEHEKKLKELKLFYIPGDRVGPRKARMERAELYGAVTTKDISEATHIVVDSNLTYKDIENHIPSVAGKHAPAIANDQWPLQCILRKSVFLPTYTYRPKGTPTGEPAASTVSLATPAPQASLELKGTANNRNRWDYVSPETTQASERAGGSNEVPSEPIEKLSQQPVPAQPISSSSKLRPDADDAGKDAPHHSQVQRQSSGFGDELAEIMNQVREEFKDLPRIGEDDANAQGDGEKEKPGDSDSGDDSDGERKRKRPKKKSVEEYFACSRGGTKDGDESNPNAETIAVLKKMSEYYTQTNDHWRMTSYRKAIKVLERTVDRKITTAEEALELPCFGPRLSAKLEEIVNTRSLARLEYATSDPMSKVLSLFLGIYGVGKATADKWIAKGYRTLDDLVQKAKLTEHQKLGIDHYEDLNTRIPRAEVTQLGDLVKAEAARIDPSVILLVGGSYRRGAETSGDIDFIITKAGTTSSKELVPFLSKLVGNLWRSGFFTAEVASHTSAKDSTGSTWHGCCILPRIAGFNDDESYRPIWRRIDLLLVPESEYGAALIYFTGNDIFNRSMRLLASRKGMRLNQRGLYKDVLRGADRMKVTEGELVEGKDEKKIFEILKVKWREPSQRWC